MNKSEAINILKEHRATLGKNTLFNSNEGNKVIEAINFIIKN